MIIARVEVREHRIPLREAYAISGQHFDVAEMVELRLVTDGMAIGIGCAAPASEVTGECAAAAAIALRDALHERLVGRTLADAETAARGLEAELHCMPAARAALDIALHDLRAKACGLPLVELLGRVHDALPTSVTIGVLALEETLDAAERHLARGFRALKVKTGRDVELDIERLVRLRERCGPAILLRTDANAGYTCADLRRFGAATRDLMLELCEQPLPRGCESELLAFPAATCAKLAADESLHGAGDVAALLAEPRPFGIWNLKLMKTGGIRSARALAEIAAREGLDVMWGCNDESAVSIAAALAAALSSRATRYLDLDGSLDLTEDFARGGFEIRDGCLLPLPEPGLGVYVS